MTAEHADVEARVRTYSSTGSMGSHKHTCNTPRPLPPISSHIYQSWVRDDLERLNVLIISLDSWSAAAVKNETAISWPPVLLIRKRTIPHHRMDRLPDAWGRKPRWCVRVHLECLFYAFVRIHLN